VPTTFCPIRRPPSPVDQARSREWNFPHESHISCPIRAASPGVPPREPSQACGRQTTYPARGRDSGCCSSRLRSAAGPGGTAGRVAGCSLANHHQGHGTRTGRSVHRGWIRGRHGDGNRPGKRERQPGARQRHRAGGDRDSARPPGFALHPPHPFLPQVFRRPSRCKPFLIQVPGVAVSPAISKQ
jgi:hypothetical protein